MSRGDDAVGERGEHASERPGPAPDLEDRVVAAPVAACRAAGRSGTARTRRSRAPRGSPSCQRSSKKVRAFSSVSSRPLILERRVGRARPPGEGGRFSLPHETVGEAAPATHAGHGLIPRGAGPTPGAQSSRRVERVPTEHPRTGPTETPATAGVERGRSARPPVIASWTATLMRLPLAPSARAPTPPRESRVRFEASATREPTPPSARNWPSRRLGFPRNRWWSSRRRSHPRRAG